MISAYFLLLSGLTKPPKLTEPLFEGLGNYHRKITTRAKMAARYFDQGLNFVYGFNMDEAIRSFEQATRLDPKCAMAHWGIALACSPNINDPEVSYENSKKAIAAIRVAERLTAHRPSVERDLIRAMKKRFVGRDQWDRSGMDKDYAAAMKKVWRLHPHDPEVGALYAEAMMDLHPWDLWVHGKPQKGTMEIVATLKKVIGLYPKHPFANHLMIHAVEAAPNPYIGLMAADTLNGLQPGLGHNVHMPSHIYVKTGRWKDSIDCNERAIAIDSVYRRRRPRTGSYTPYMAHNCHMLTFSAMMAGKSQEAIGTIDRLMASLSPQDAKERPFIMEGLLAMSLEVRKRFGKWDQILNAREIPDKYPTAVLMSHVNRAIAFAAKGRPDDAAMEQTLFAQAREKSPFASSPILKLAEHLMNGEVLIAEGNEAKAIAELKQAVKVEDSLPYNEPPDWITPARHTLGAYLVKRGKYAQALAVYRADLKIWPNNGWSLYGMSAALDGLGRANDAARFKKKFDQVWAQADTSITSSCLCVPGKK